MAGGLAVPESGILESFPVDAMAQVAVPVCATGDTTCSAQAREYSFGIAFPDEAPLKQGGVALLGLAAVGAAPTMPPGGCLLGVTSGVVSLADSWVPATLTVSLLKWAPPPKSCISYGTAPLIASIAFDHTSHSDGTSRDILTIDGWNFRPDLALDVVTKCNNIKINYKTQQLAALGSDGVSKILLVTPSRIVAELAMVDLMNTSCAPGNGKRYVAVSIPADSKMATEFLLQ